MPAPAPPVPSFRPTWTWFLASDPGLLRLRSGACVAISVILTGALLWGLSALTGNTLESMTLGYIVSMMGTVAVRDPTPGARHLTLVLGALAAFASFALATWLSAHAWLADTGFLVVIFAAVEARRLGPRGGAMGMLAFMAYFLGVFLRRPLAQLPPEALATAAAAMVVAVVRFVFLPDRPVAAVPRIVRALQRQAALLADRLAGDLASGDWSWWRRRRLAHAVAALGESVMLADRQVRSVPGAPERATARLRATLFGFERALERLGQGAHTVGQAPLRLREALTELAARLRDAPAPDTVGARSGQRTRPQHELAERVAAVGHARADLDAALREWLERTPRQAPASSGKGADDAGPPPRRHGLHPATAQAIQVTLASGIAMAAGYLVSGRRWYWAVIAAFVMFLGTGTRGESILKAAERIAGTLAGVLAGLALGTALAGHTWLGIGVLPVLVFLAFYSFPVSYAAMIFWFTLLIAVAYGLLGYFSPSLLWTRLAETGVGAAAGVLVALFVLPTHTQPKVRQAEQGFLDAMGAVLARLGEAAGPLPAQERRRLIARLDGSYAAIRQARGPATLGLGLRAPGGAGRRLLALMACRYWAHELVDAGAPRQPAAAWHSGIHAVCAELERHSRGARGAAGRDGAPVPDATGASTGALRHLLEALRSLPTAG